MGRGFSEVGDRRYKKLKNDLEICKEFNWSLSDLRKLTMYERHSVIRYINDLRKKMNRENRKSKHNYWPSKAFDFHIYVPGRPDLTWNEDAIIFVAGIIMGTAQDLYNQGSIRSKIRWGGNFDRDNIIGSVEGEFFDPVHIEIE